MADSDASPVLTPQLLLAAYAQGVFPMGRRRDDPCVEWYSPDPRAVLPLDRFKCPRSLRQRVQRSEFQITLDTAFSEVIAACAEPRNAERQTWINQPIIDAFCDLHRLGFAHSVEAWRDEHMVGGLYGVGLGGAFFGESMFHRADLGGTDASKVCLVHLVQHLQQCGFVLLDVQFVTPHLEQFGVIEIGRDDYLQRLRLALAADASW